MKYKIKLKYKISTIPKVDIVLILLYFAKIQLIMAMSQQTVDK